MDEIPVSLAIAQAAKETVGVHQGLLRKVMHYLDSGFGQARIKTKDRKMKVIK